MNESAYNNAVRSIQIYLRQLEHEKGGINRIPIDGIYGEDTKEAVIRFQTDENLEADGTVDFITWNRLIEKYEASLEQNSSVIGISPFFDTQSDYEISEGDSNTLVNILDVILEELSTEYTFIEGSLEMNGIYDNKKSDIISTYQKINLLPVTGTVNRSTWNRLAGDFNYIMRKNN